jgi:hypothetical protein
MAMETVNTRDVVLQGYSSPKYERRREAFKGDLFARSSPTGEAGPGLAILLQLVVRPRAWTRR